MPESSSTFFSFKEFLTFLDKMPAFSFVELPGGTIFINKQARKLLNLEHASVSEAEWRQMFDGQDYDQRKEGIQQYIQDNPEPKDGILKFTYWLHNAEEKRLKIQEDISWLEVEGRLLLVSNAFVLEGPSPTVVEEVPMPGLSKVIDSMRLGVEYLSAVRDSEGQIVDFEYRIVNQHAFQLIDIKRKLSSEIIGKRLLEIFPKFPEADFFRYVNVLESGEPLSNEFLYPLYDKAKGNWYRQHVSRVDDGILIVYECIDEQKQHEQELLGNNQLLDSLLDSTAIGIDLIRPLRDEDGKVYDFKYEVSNQQALKVHRSYGTSHTVGKTILEVYPTIKNLDLFDKLLEVLETGVSARDELFFDYMGKDNWFYYNYIKFGDGILITHLDITEAKASEQLLKESNDFIEGVLNTSSAAIEALEAVRDEEGNIVDFVYLRTNQKSREIQLRLRKKHMEGTSLISLYPQIQNNGLLQRLINVVNNKQSIQMEIPYQFDHEIRWFLSDYGSFGADGLLITFIDITQLKNAEEKLKDALYTININHNNLLKMIDSTDDFICSVDNEFRFMAFNRAYQEEFEKIFGVRIEQGMRMADAVQNHPEPGQKMLQIWENAIRGNPDAEALNFGINEKNDYDIHFHKIYGPQKEVLGLTGFARNLSRKKKIEKALKDADDFLLLSEHLPNIVFTLNSDGKPEYFNDAFYKFTGLSPAQINRKVLRQKVHPDDLNELKSILGNYVVENKYTELEVRFRLQHRSGEYRWVLLKAVPVIRGNSKLRNWLGSVTDIHEQVKVETVESKAAEEFRQIAEGLPQMVWVTEPDGYTNYFNQQWYKYTGTGPEENLGDAWVNRIHPNDLERTKLTWNESVSQKKDYRIEYRIRSKEGMYRWFLGRGIPVQDEQGEVQKWFGTCTDIEDQKQQQRQLKRQNQRLNELNEYLENYVNALAHDLRAPVANMQGLIGLLQESSNHQLKEKAMTNLGISVNRLDNTIIGLIRLIESQHDKEAPAEQLDILSCFEYVKSEFEKDLLQQRAEVVTDLNISEVKFVKNYLEEAFRSFLSNAINFRRANVPLVINLRSWQEDNHVVVAFSDNGIGIDLETHGKHLFKPFFRSNTQAEGRGISLHIVNHMFRHEGGKIEVDSQLGRGTTFRLYIPLIE